MLLTRYKLALVALMVALNVAELPSQQPNRRDAAFPRGVQRPEVHGIVKAVDTGKGILTVTVGGGRQEPGERTFAFGPSTEVGIGQAVGRRVPVILRAGKVTDLAPGTVVALQLTPDEKMIEFLVAEGPTWRAVIKSVDPAKHTVTVSVGTRDTGGRGDDRRDHAGEEKTLMVDAKTEVALDDGRSKIFSIKEVKLADLPAGALATVRLSLDLKRVDSILAEGPVLQGEIRGVDLEKRQFQLVVHQARGEEQASLGTFLVPSDAEVWIDDGKGRHFSLKEGKLADLAIGAIAQVKLSPDQKLARSIRAEGPSIQGAVQSVDGNKGTITLTVRLGRGRETEDKTFAVAGDAHIVIDGKQGMLVDIKSGDNAPPARLRLSLDQKTVHGIVTGEGRQR